MELAKGPHTENSSEIKQNPRTFTHAKMKDASQMFSTEKQVIFRFTVFELILIFRLISFRIDWDSELMKHTDTSILSSKHVNSTNVKFKYCFAPLPSSRKVSKRPPRCTKDRKWICTLLRWKELQRLRPAWGLRSNCCQSLSNVDS